MDQLDLNIHEALSALAALVNQASRPEDTSAEAVKVCKVPVGLLYTAKRALERWRDTEYTTNAIRQACNRSLS